MLYDLVKKVGREWESMGRTHDFEGEKPPSLSKNKGKWVPRIVNRIPAGFDEALQYAKKTKTVTSDAVTMDYSITDKTPDELAAEKMRAWKSKIRASDASGITRDLESVISVLTEAQMARLDSVTKDKYTAKVALRARRPV